MNILKNSSSHIVWKAVFVGFVLSAVPLFYFSLKKQIVSNSIPVAVGSIVQEEGNFSLPVRLNIPKINVDATVELMGLTPQGTMEAPKAGRNVGWYSAGPHPGNIGSAVIDGHFGRWKNGEGSVFDDLSKLQKGDKVYVEDEKGGTATFVVRMLRTYDPKADTTDVFSSDDEQAHLNLITCEGIWDKVSKSYSGRLVVFADKE